MRLIVLGMFCFVFGEEKGVVGWGMGILGYGGYIIGCVGDSWVMREVV